MDPHWTGRLKSPISYWEDLRLAGLGLLHVLLPGSRAVVLSLPLWPHSHGVGGAGLERGRGLRRLRGCWAQNTGSESSPPLGMWLLQSSDGIGKGRAPCGDRMGSSLQEFLPREFRCLRWDRTKGLPEGVFLSQAALKWFKIHLLG